MDDNKKVVLVTEEDKKKPWAVTWDSIVFYVKKYLYWVIGATIIMGIVGYSAISFVYNPKRATFKIGFSYQKQNFISKTDSEGKVTLYYADGTLFNPQNIVSEDNMKAVIDASTSQAREEYKESHPDATEEQIENIKGSFSNIDYEKIANQNLLKITAITDTSLYDSSQYIAYDISGYNNDFPNDELVESFCLALIQNGQLGMFTSLENFRPDTNLIGFDAITTPYDKFDSQISMLKNEMDYLFNYYQSLEDVFSPSATVKTSSGTSTLGQISQSFRNALGIDPISTDDSVSNVSRLQNYITYTDNTSGTSLKMSYVYIDPDSRKSDYINYFQQNLSVYNTKVAQLEGQITTLQQEYNSISAKLNSTEISDEEKSILSEQLNENITQSNQYKSNKAEYEEKAKNTQYKLNFINSVSDTEENPWGSYSESESQTYITNTLQSIYDTLKNEAETFKLVYITLYQNVSQISRKTVKTLYRNIMETDNTIGWYWGAAAGVILGFLGSAIVTTFVGQGQRRYAILTGQPDPIIPKEKKEEKDSSDKE